MEDNRNFNEVTNEETTFDNVKEITEEMVDAVKEGVDAGLKQDKKKGWNPVTWFNGLKLWQKLALGAVAGTILVVGGYKLHIKLHHGKLIAEAAVNNADQIVETVTDVVPEVVPEVAEVATDVVEAVADVAEEAAPF